MLAAHTPSTDKSGRIALLLRSVIQMRCDAETMAMNLSHGQFPYLEFCLNWALQDIERGDIERRQAEDLCFATNSASWESAQRHLDAAHTHYGEAWRHKERFSGLFLIGNGMHMTFEGARSGWPVMSQKNTSIACS